MHPKIIRFESHCWFELYVVLEICNQIICMLNLLFTFSAHCIVVVETSIIVYLMPGHFQSGSQMSNLNTLIQMHDMMTDSNEVADFRT